MEREAIKAVILAGGQGTRVRHLLPDVPKPMALAAGRPFIEWVVRFLAKQGLTDILISTGYRAEIILSHFERLQLPGVRIGCVSEETPLGTAGGFMNAITAEDQGGAWLVCNGDSLVLSSIDRLVSALAQPEIEAVVMALSGVDSTRFGKLEIDARGRLVRFSEKQTGLAPINAGVYLLARSLTTRVPPKRPLSFETDLFPEWLNMGVGVLAAIEEAPFLDIGTEETLSLATDFVNRHPQYFL